MVIIDSALRQAQQVFHYVDERHMRQPLAPIAQIAHRPSRERRRSGRVRQQSLRSNLGQVLDVSATGMRTSKCWGMRVGTMVDVTIRRHALNGALRGRIMWSRRTGLFRHEIGVEFVEPDPNVVHRLATIAGCAGLRRIRASTDVTFSRVI
jgi:hypothetical protein